MFTRFQAVSFMVTGALLLAGCNRISIDDVSKIQGQKVDQWQVHCTELGFTLDKQGLRGVVVDVNHEEPAKSRGYLIKVFGDEYQLGTDTLEGLYCGTSPQLNRAALEKLKGERSRKGN